MFLTGYTPYPRTNDDRRLPHEASKLHKQIHKTALGAEETVVWQQESEVMSVLSALKANGFTVAAVEQTALSVKLPGFEPPEKIALLVGREVEGVEPAVLELCDTHLEIPMYGQKESFNVVQAAAMALYHCRFIGL